MQYELSGEQGPPDLRASVRSKAEHLSSIAKVLSWVAVGVGSLLTVLLVGMSGSVFGGAESVDLLVILLLGAIYTFGAWLHLTLLAVLSGYMAVRLAERPTQAELVAR